MSLPGRYLIAVALVSLSTAGLAQDTRDDELAWSDRNLNVTYRALARQLRPADRIALRNAELAWIAFRDADCAFAMTDTRDCLAQRTDEREKQLRDTTYFDAAGEIIRLPDPTR